MNALNRSSPPGKRNRPARCRGVALMVVLVAVVVATVLGMAFLMAQATASGVARNLEDKTRARLIAESGMEVVRQQILSTPQWGETASAGRWVSDQPLGDGSFSVDLEELEPVDAGQAGRYSLTVTGRYASAVHVVRYEITPLAGESQDEPVAAGTVAVADSIVMSGSSRIDAYASAQGPYTQSNQSDQAVVGTNGAYSQVVQLSGSARIQGQLLIGPGGSPTAAAVVTGGSKITGGVAAMTVATAMPALAMPPGAPVSAGALSRGADSSLTISENKRYSSMNIGGAARVTINGDLTIWCDGSFNIGGSAQFTIPEGSSLKLYVNGDVNIAGSSRFNPASEAPGRLQIFILGLDNDLHLGGSAQCSAYVQNPEGKLSIQGSGQFHGRYLGQALAMSGSGRLHLDISDTGGSQESGTTGASGVAYIFRWDEGL